MPIRPQDENGSNVGLPHCLRTVTITFMTLWPMSGIVASTVVLAGSAAAAAIGSNAAANVMNDGNEPAPAAWSLSAAVMTAAIAIAAVHRNPQMITAAVSVCFSSSVAAITLALGIVLIVARHSSNETSIAVSRRASLLMPVALLIFFIGFGGAIRPATAGILVLEGLAILPLCARKLPSKLRRPVPMLQLIVALTLVFAAGWTAMSAAAGLAQRSEIFRSGVLPALVLGPVVILPIVPAIATLAESGFATAAIDAVTMLALLNFCVVLPLLWLVHPELPIPLLTWRLDTLLIVVIGMLLLPPSIGRWTLGRREGVALVACFVLYLMITLIATIG